jgi:hypothetical protein
MLGETESIMPGASFIIDSLHVERLRLNPGNNRWAQEFIVGDTLRIREDAMRKAHQDSLQRR